MKVLVLTPDLSRPGGVANYYRCIELDKEEGIDYFFINEESIESNKLFIKKLNRYTRLIKKYIVFTSRIKLFDIIHVNPSLGFKSFYRDLGFIILARLFRKKIIIFFRGWDNDFELKVLSSRLLMFLFRLSYAKANVFIVLGQTFKNKLINLGVEENSTFFFETTIADSRYLNDLNIQEKFRSYSETLEILFISRILTSKGVYIALKAFDECQRSISKPMRLYIAGDGEELFAVKEYVKNRAINNVIFPGYVKDDRKKDLLLNCHILFFPTLYGEGMPNAVLEGMLYAMPIISRDVGGLPDIVNYGVNGYLSNSQDSAVFSKYLMQLATDKSSYESMAIRNHQLASERFLTEKVKHRILNIYKSI